MSSYGGIVGLLTKGCYYGIQCRVLMPQFYFTAGKYNEDYFDAYLAFVNPAPHQEGDARVEAGIAKYSPMDNAATIGPCTWSYISWAPDYNKLAAMKLERRGPSVGERPLEPIKLKVPGDWHQDNVPLTNTAMVGLKLRFAPSYAPRPDHANETQVTLFVNGVHKFDTWVTLSRESFDRAGMRMKLCIGIGKASTVMGFDRITLDRVMVCHDKQGQDWRPLKYSDCDPVDTPAVHPTLLQRMPLSASWMPLGLQTLQEESAKKAAP